MDARQIGHVFVLTALLAAAGARLAMAGADDGKKIFDAKKCIGCHSLADQKGAMAKMGGPLDGVGGKRDAAWLKAYLTDPKSKVPNAKMPKQAYSESELEGLVQYMLSLK